MALTIQDYLPPGAYSTIIPNPTVASSAGIPVVAVVGQALRGPYTPQTYFTSDDVQSVHGIASKSNPLSLAAQIAFENGAPRVLTLNVQPDNSLPASLNINPFTASFPSSAFVAAPPSAIDAVTQQPVNSTGSIAGSFYIQDFNPQVADPVYNSTPQASQQAFALAGSSSMLQYEKLLGATQVPLANSQEAQILVYTVDATTPPASATFTQSQWNQFNNAVALMNAFNGAYQTPVGARMLIPDTAQTGYSPVPGYSDLFEVLAQVNSTGTYTINSGGAGQQTFTHEVDVYNYFIASGGVLNVYALNPGTQHQIIFGLFDSNVASTNPAGTLQAFGLPVQNGSSGNPFGVIQNGSDGVVTNNSFITALKQLQNVRADILVVLNTDPAVQDAIKTHVTTMSSREYRNERIAIVSGPISEQYQTTIQNVTALQGGPGAKRMMYIFPTAAYRFDQVLNTTVALDGTYLAAACAGILASGDAAEPLTHKVLSGFRDVAVHLDDPTANSIAKYGVCIIENNPNFGLRVRDQLSCDPSTPDTQEISVTRQLDYTAQTLRDLMDANVVATKITRGTLAVVQALATSSLQSLVDNQIIADFANVVARQDPMDGRRIQLRVTVKPAYPCKYVDITISITSDLSQGAATSTVGS